MRKMLVNLIRMVCFALTLQVWYANPDEKLISNENAIVDPLVYSTIIFLVFVIIINHKIISSNCTTQY